MEEGQDYLYVEEYKNESEVLYWVFRCSYCSLCPFIA